MPLDAALSFGLTPSCAAIVERLARSPSTWVATEQLNHSTATASRMYDHAAKLRGSDTVKVHVHAIRQKLGDDFILGHCQYGFALGAPGILACKRAATGNI